MAPLGRGLQWLGSRPPTGRRRPRWVLPAAFVATALAAGLGGYLVHSGGSEPQAKAAGGPASPAARTAPQVLDAKGVFDRLVAAGLPVTNPVSVTASTDPNHLLGKPNSYTSRLSFTAPGGDPKADQYGIGRGGIVEVFATADDAKRGAD